jgi:hypothetical protein
MLFLADFRRPALPHSQFVRLCYKNWPFVSSGRHSGLLVGADVHPTDAQDCVGAPFVIAALHDVFPWLHHLFPTAPMRARSC